MKAILTLRLNRYKLALEGRCDMKRLLLIMLSVAILAGLVGCGMIIDELEFAEYTQPTAPEVTAEEPDLNNTPVKQEDVSKPTATVELSNVELDGSFYEEEKVYDMMDDVTSDGIVKKLMSFGFTDNEAKDIRKTFIMCGITNIDGCEPTDPEATIDGLVSFREVWDKDRTFWFTVDNREMFYISLNGVDVFDKDKGGFLININDVHVPVSDVDVETFLMLQDVAAAEIDKYLKYPNSAYYDAWAIAREDDKYMIQCEVRAQNALKIKEWLVCKVWFDNTNSDFAIEGISIDGTQVK